VEVAVMSIGASIALFVIGAVLRFGVTLNTKYVDIDAIGVILMIAGVACLLISIGYLVYQRSPRASTQVYEERRYSEPPR
jgi:hypothetical protein